MKRLAFITLLLAAQTLSLAAEPADRPSFAEIDAANDAIDYGHSNSSSKPATVPEFEQASADAEDCADG